MRISIPIRNPTLYRTASSYYHTPKVFRKQSEQELNQQRLKYATGLTVALVGAYLIPWSAFRDRIFFPEDDDDDDKKEDKKDDK